MQSEDINRDSFAVVVCVFAFDITGEIIEFQIESNKRKPEPSQPVNAASYSHSAHFADAGGGTLSKYVDSEATDFRFVCAFVSFMSLGN